MFVQDHHTLEELQQLAKALTKKRIWLRYQAVVLAKQGHSALAIAHALGCSRRAVQTWVAQYNQGGVPALQERPHTGRPPTRPVPKDGWWSVRPATRSIPRVARRSCEARSLPTGA